MTEVKKIKPYFNNDELEFSVYAAQYSPVNNNKTVFAGSSNPNCVRVFENPQGKTSEYFHSWSITGFEKGVYSLMVSPNDKFMAVGSGDKKLSIININNFE